MRSPRYTDSDLHRMLYGQTGARLEWDLDVSILPVDECRCYASDEDARGCARPYTFADGAIRLSCSNGDTVIDALADEGFGSADDELDVELLKRLDRAAERERKAQRKAAAEVDATLAGIETRSDRQRVALLKASEILAEADFPSAALAKAGRALREGTR